MPREVPQKREIQSFGEIPSFLSEDEEVEFWDTHTLGDALLDLMEPLPEEILPVDRSRPSRRVKSRKVVFFDGLTVDGYQIPSGEFRIGTSGASTVLGYSEDWLSWLLANKTGDPIQALRRLGFTGETQMVIIETSRGEREAQTISLRDFDHLISYGASEGKKAAYALQVALAKVHLGVLEFFRDAFGELHLPSDERRRFQKVYLDTYS